MTYKIKEIFFTQQGEGTNTGKDFVFVRFSGCSLWSGKEKNRASAICKSVSYTHLTLPTISDV